MKAHSSPAEVTLSCVLWFHGMLLGFMSLIVVTQILAKLIRSQAKLSGQATDALKRMKIQSYPKMNIRELKQQRKRHLKINIWEMVTIL